MKGKVLSVSCTYSECGQPPVKLLRESFQFFLKKELIARDTRPQML